VLPSRSDGRSAEAGGVADKTFGISVMAFPKQTTYADLIKDERRRTVMDTETRDMVVVITNGIEHELSSAGLIIALGGLTAGLRVSIFLTRAGVDIVRRGASDMTHVRPLEPLADMLRDFLARGGTLWACTSA
jgi:hypothetical protein